jgi:hypothetical protein
MRVPAVAVSARIAVADLGVVSRSRRHPLPSAPASSVTWLDDMATRSGVTAEPETDPCSEDRALAVGVTMEQILCTMAALLGVSGSASPVHLNPTGEHGDAPAGSASLEDVIASGAAAVEDLLAGTFSSPDEALRFLPQLIAGLMGSSATPADVEVDGATTAAPAPVDIGGPQEDVIAAALRVAGVDVGDFEQALTAALEEGLPVAARCIHEGSELFAMAAAGACVIPGGAAAVDRYLARREHDPEARRWGARVRALVREHRSAPRPLPRSAPRRGTARRTRRPRSHHRVRRLSRAGPHEGPAPSESDSPNARSMAQGGEP